MESVIVLKSREGELESSSLIGSSEKVAALGSDNLNALKSDSETQADPLDSVTSTTECADEKFSRRELCLSSPSLDSETGENSPAVGRTQDLEMLSVCQTPRGSIFDPFAPGPQEMALAPNPKNKTKRITKMPLRRRLIFDLVCDSEEVKDKEDALLESICNSFIELIVSNQIKEISNEYLTQEDYSCEDLKTPTSVGFPTGIADTCSLAPEISNEYLTEEDNSREDLKTPTSVRFLTGIADTCPPAPDLSNEYLTEEDNSREDLKTPTSARFLTGVADTCLPAPDISNEYLTEEDNSREDLKTPTSVRFLTGIADTCPPAPMRPFLKFRKLDPSICRKLEFGSNMI